MSPSYHKRALKKMRNGGLAHGRYIGPRADLRGETALVRRVAGDLAAQFDNFNRFGGVPGSLALDWHQFPMHQFKVGP